MEETKPQIISREEAINSLMDLLVSGILKEELENDIQRIIQCIEEEKYGRHIWGTDIDDYTKMHLSARADLLTDEQLDEIEAIEKKYSFIPAPYEDDEITRNQNEAEGLYEMDEAEAMLYGLGDAPEELPFP